MVRLHDGTDDIVFSGPDLLGVGRVCGADSTGGRLCIEDGGAGVESDLQEQRGGQLGWTASEEMGTSIRDQSCIPPRTRPHLEEVSSEAPRSEASVAIWSVRARPQSPVSHAWTSGLCKGEVTHGDFFQPHGVW